MNTDVNGRLVQLKNEKGLSMTALAKRIGVTAPALARIISQASAKPSFDLLFKLAETFPDVRMEWLIRGEGSILKTSDAADAECREELDRLGRKYKDLEDEHDRLQLSFSRQAKLVALLGGTGAAGE